MSSEPTKWEPSEASIAEYHKMRFRVWGRGGDYAEETKLALKAAVGADPLLRAAEEMRNAIESALSYVGIDEFLDNRKVHGAHAWGVTKDDLLKLRAALAKAKGE